MYKSRISLSTYCMYSSFCCFVCGHFNSALNGSFEWFQVPQKESISIETKNIPFGQESTNFTPKSTNKICDSSSNGNIVQRRTSNATKQLGEDLIDLNNGVEDTWAIRFFFCCFVGFILFAILTLPVYPLKIYRLRVSVLEAFDPLLSNDDYEAADQGNSTKYYNTNSIRKKTNEKSLNIKWINTHKSQKFR